MKSTRFSLRRARYAALMIALVLVLITTIGAQNQPASSSSKQPIPISNCGLINKSGSYVVTADLSALGGPCLQIAADNVTLHVAGHSVATAAGGLSATSVKNLAIIGPGSFFGSGPGIELINVTNSQVVGVNSAGDGVGIHVHNDAAGRASNRIVANKVTSKDNGFAILAESQGNVYLGNELTGDNFAGMQIQGGEGDLIEGNNCNRCIQYGLFISGTHETIVGNQADNGVSDLSVGIFVDGTGNLVRNNEATGNQVDDLVDNSDVCGSNTWKANAFTTANLLCIN